MGISQKVFTRHNVRKLVLIFLSLISTIVNAGDFTVYPTTADDDGSYTLSWNTNGTGEFVSLEVKEYLNGEFSGNVATSGTSVSLSERISGTYRYDLSIRRRYFISRDNTYVYSTSIEDSVTFSVAISIPSPAIAISPDNETFDGGYTVSWNRIPGDTTSTLYKLEEKVGTGDFAEIQSSNSSSKIFGSIPQGSYQYQVKACNGSTCSLFSPTKSINVAFVPDFTHSTSTHNTILGDYNGDSKQDAFYQTKLNNVKGGVLPVNLHDPVNANLHRSWTTTHPDFSAIEDWSEQNYSAFSGNFNSNPGDELLLLGNKKIVLIHGDIITPITIFPAVHNAIVSWDSNNTASYSEFEFDANPADYEVHVGNLNSDSYDEIFLQGKTKGSRSYILNSDGTLIQTLNNGYLNIDWSAASYNAEITSGQIKLTAISSVDYDNLAVTNSSGSVTNLQIPLTKPSISGTSQRYVYTDNVYAFKPDYQSNYNVTFGFSGLPSWLQFNSATGDLYGTPPSSDVGSIYNIKITIYENKSHTIDNSMSFTLEVVESFQIPKTGYTVYKSTDGTIYLVSDNGLDIFKLVDDNNGLAIIRVSQADFNAVNATLDSDYQVIVVDQDLDGVLDLMLQPVQGSEASRILVTNILSSYHNVFEGSFVEPAPEIHIEPIPTVDITSQQVGAISASFRVDEGGSATYNIPINLPEGTAGVKPELALNYSSGGQNGLIGQGWNLSGLSMITRCKATQETDGANESMLSVTYSSTDKYCLDGSRLVAVNGTYGSNGTEYATEINSFQRIISHGVAGAGPAYFTVESKDGATRYYGNTTDSKLFVNDSIEATTTIAQWAINKSIDSVGNYINYLYTKDDTKGVQRISEIDYTGNIGLSPYNFIYFDYEDREDSRDFYVFGSLSSIEKRLKTIRIETPDPISDLSTQVKRYELDYEISSSNNISLLNQITECSGTESNTCLSPTTFKWSHGKNGFALSPYSGTVQDKIIAADPIDFDGDGLTDLAILAKSDSGSYHLLSGRVTENGVEFRGPYNPLPSGEENFIASHVGDIDGDGKMDVLAPGRIGSSGDIWWYYIYNGTDYGLVPGRSTGIAYDASQDQKQLMLGDMNGDGLPDLIYQISKTQVGIRENDPSNPGTFGVERTITISITENPYNGLLRWVEGIDSLQDRNGDGKMDIVFVARSCTEHTEIPGTCRGPDGIGTGTLFGINTTVDGVEKYVARSSQYISSHSKVKYMDVNGDGLLETVHSGGYYLNKGNDTSEIIYFDTITNFDRGQTIDYNGDGMMDIVYPVTDSAQTWEVRLSNGVTFDPGFKINLFRPYSTTSAQDIHLFGDFFGKGEIAHLLIMDGKDFRLTFANSSETPRNVITRFENGFGEFQQVTYKPLTDSSVYTKGDTSTRFNYGNGSPVFDIVAPIYVVSQATGSAPNYLDFENTLSVSYSYENARVQSGGRGFLGFEKVFSTDEETGIITGTKFRQDFPFIGKPIKTVSAYFKANVDEHLDEVCVPMWCIRATSSIIKRTTTTWELQQVSDGRTNFPYLSWSSSSISQGGPRQGAQTTQTVDDYNNVLNIIETKTEVNNGTRIISKVTTTNEYNEDNISNWFLGRLTNTTVVSERPSEDQSEVPPMTRESSFTYDSVSGLLEREIINPNGSVNLKLVTAYEYDEFGNITRQTQCSGHIPEANCGTSTEVDLTNPYHINRYSRNVWDSRGRFVDKTYNGLEQLTLEVNSRHITGQPTQLTDLDGVVVDKAYDAHGRLYFERSSVGAWKYTTQTQHVPESVFPYTVVKTSSGSGVADTIEYIDLLGRVAKTKTKAFNGVSDIVTLKKFDSRGRLYGESLPHIYGTNNVNWTTYSYDDFGRVLTTTYPNSLTSTINYSDEYALITTNQIGQTRTEERNVLGELTGTYENGDSSLKTTYQYDALGKLKKTIDIDSIQTAFIEYDVLGRKISMSDRDTGTWTYDYNALGELVSQTDANLDTTTFFYDRLGRMTHRVETGDVVVDTYWYYDNFGGQSYPGKLIHEIDSLSGFSKTYAYDTLGRSTSVTTHVPASGVSGQNGYVAAQDYIESVTYDEYGRVFQQFDASGNEAGIRFVYNSNGYLERVRDTRHNESTFYYKIKAMDAFGNITNVETGNGIESIRNYDDQTGLLKTITTGSSGEIQTLEYNFNAIGRLEWRESYTTEGGFVRETFGYDGLNRLETATLNNSEIEPLVVQYEANGNIKNKSDVSANDYSYTSNHAACTTTSDTLHAVKQIGTKYFCYDKKGNQTKTIDNGSVTRSVVYNQFSKPTEILNGSNGHTTSFQYGPDRSRYVRVDNTGSEINTTHYIGGLEIHYKNNGEVEYKRSIGGRAVVTVKGSGIETNYLHKDYQGSITAITNDDANPSVVQRMSFDPFGKRRAEFNWDSLDEFSRLTFSHEITTRGYTGHEMLDEVGIIHMNGRTYDAHIGRFMQADIAVQDPGNGQNLNRFSYVLNSPMSYTDPSGYFYYQVPAKPKNNTNYGLLAIQIMVAAGTAGQSLWLQMGTQAVLGYVSTGDIGGAARGAFTAWMFHTVGDYLEGAAAGTKIVAHALAGGVSSVIQGDEFGHGFMSSFITSLAGPTPSKIGSGFGQVITAAIVGGTVSEMTGGKFANGAITSAFQWAFNDQSHGSQAGEVYDNDENGKLQALKKGVKNVIKHRDILNDLSWSDVNGDYQGGNSSAMLYVDQVESVGFLSLKVKYGTYKLILSETTYGEYSHDGGLLDGGSSRELYAHIRTTKISSEQIMMNRFQDVQSFQMKIPNYVVSSDNKVFLAFGGKINEVKW